MPIPTDPEKREHMFTDDMKFLQKAIIYHPERNEFLALKRSTDAYSRPNCWDLPGGNVLFGENHLDSLIKEIMDETSLIVKDIQPIQVVTNYRQETYFLFIGYSCRATSSSVKISNEHSMFKWTTKKEFLQLKSSSYLIDMVRNQI